MRDGETEGGRDGVNERKRASRCLSIPLSLNLAVGFLFGEIVPDATGE
jgi:hypothetical protein